MFKRKHVFIILLSSCVALPIVIGASCPPPSSPFYYAVITDDDTLTQQALPSCTPGFVCINMTNQTTVPVQMALYTHNGYDENNQYPDTPSFSCCTNPNSTVACPCPCPGAETGECMLNYVELFLLVNLDQINIATNPVTLLPGQSAQLVRIRCEQIKTIGVSVALDTGDPINAPLDQNGPVYEPQDVPCGETVRFSAVDLGATQGGSTGGSTTVTTIVIQRDVSS